MNVLFIHGRAQEDYTQEELLRGWRAALELSFKNAKLDFPQDFNLILPYYGKELIVQRDLYKKDIADGVYQMRSPDEIQEIQTYEKELVEIMRKNAKISQKEVTDEIDAEQQDRGTENWRATLAITRLLDKHFNSVSNGCVKRATDDVVTYLIVPEARKVINDYYIGALTNAPTIIIAHSLGTIVAYDVLRSLDPNAFDIRGLITIGSPLGVNAVQRQLLQPMEFPKSLKGKWINIYDRRDIVSLNPLNRNNFRISPEIINYEVDNDSDNRHKIKEYLSNELIANIISDMANN